jgi:cation:H+ antiporter
VENEPRPHPGSRLAVWFLYAIFIAATVSGTALARVGHGLELAQWVVPAACFAAVITASLLISWAGEAAQFLISQGLIVAIIALLQVLPEFMIEAVFAWRADTPNMLANLTGSNRLLMGLGWPLIYVTAMTAHWIKTKRLLGPIELRPEHAVEVWALIISSGYFLVILARGSFVLWDGFVLFAMFIAYLVILSKLPPEEEGKEDLLAPSLALVELPKRTCVSAVAVILLISGSTMVLVTGPFVDSMKAVAKNFHIAEFYFVQWVAPFLTEFPEKVTAFYWAKRVSTANMALLNMVSSKVNQWTLLASMIPIVYCVSNGWHKGVFEHAVPMEDKAIEVWLSLAMTMYGSACLLKRRFTGVNCFFLFTLWLIQFLNPDPKMALFPQLGDMRHTTTYIFAGLTVFELAWNWRAMTPLQDLKEIVRLIRSQSRKA